MKYSKRIPTLIVLVVCTLLFVGAFMFAHDAPSDDSQSSASYTEYERAKVTEIISDESSQSEEFENQYVGSQSILIELQSGQYKGATVSALNYLGSLYGTHLKVGDSIVVAIYTSDNEINNITVYEFDRTLRIFLLIGLFFLATILIGGKKGAYSLIGLILTIICLIGIMIPLLEKGAPTILTTLITCIYVAVVSFTLLDGVTKKSVCAMLGTFIGLLLAILFGLFAQSFVKVNGMRMGDYVDALIQLKQAGSALKISGLLIGGMIIAALGAIMDVAMSISSSMQELTSLNPDLTRRQLWISGMNIGRDMIGTMTNTLILAFVGSSFLLVMYIWTLDVPFYELLSSTLVATEVVHSITSSIGVILSVPITVLISTFLYRPVRKK